MKKMYSTIAIGLTALSVCSLWGCGKSDKEIVGEYQLESFKVGGEPIEIKKEQIEIERFEIKENGSFEMAMGDLYENEKVEGTWKEKNGLLYLNGKDEDGSSLIYTFSVEGDELITELIVDGVIELDDKGEMIFEKQ